MISSFALRLVGPLFCWLANRQEPGRFFLALEASGSATGAPGRPLIRLRMSEFPIRHLQASVQEKQRKRWPVEIRTCGAPFVVIGDSGDIIPVFSLEIGGRMGTRRGSGRAA